MTRDQIIEAIANVLKCNNYTSAEAAATAIVDQLGGEAFKFDTQYGNLEGTARGVGRMSAS